MKVELDACIGEEDTYIYVMRRRILTYVFILSVRFELDACMGMYLCVCVSL